MKIGYVLFASSDVDRYFSICHGARWVLWQVFDINGGMEPLPVHQVYMYHKQGQIFADETLYKRLTTLMSWTVIHIARIQIVT
jgi:hypothetical protein